jgi:hypothetical protein
MKLTIRLAGLQGRHNPNLALRFYRIDASWTPHQIDNFVEIFTPWFGRTPYVRDQFVDFYVDLDHTRLHKLGLLQAFDLMSVQSRPWSWEVSHISLVKRERTIVPATGPPPCFMQGDYPFCGFGTPPQTATGGTAAIPTTTLLATTPVVSSSTASVATTATTGPTTLPAQVTTTPLTTTTPSSTLPPTTTPNVAGGGGGGQCSRPQSECASLAIHWTRCKDGEAFASCRAIYEASCVSPPTTCVDHVNQQCASTAGAPWQVTHCTTVMNQFCEELRQCRQGGALSIGAGAQVSNSVRSNGQAATQDGGVSPALIGGIFAGVFVLALAAAVVVVVARKRAMRFSRESAYEPLAPIVE